MPADVEFTGTPDFALGSVLDDRAVHQRLDSGKMLAAIDSFPEHLGAAAHLAAQVDWLSYKPTTPAGVCVCGMGGSAIGGDLVRSYWESESPVPMAVVRSDHLPAHINRFWMVIASSYSGNTRETLAAVEEARQRGCNILAITSGGILAEQAKKSNWPLITLPGGMMPRAAVGYSIGPVFLSLTRWGIVPDREKELRSAVAALAESKERYGIASPIVTNPAKQAATIMAGRIVCVYGTTGFTDVAALRLKCQLCENSKAVAFANSLPELNHNEIVGLDASADPQRLAIVMLRVGGETELAQRRLDWVAQRASSRGIPVVTIRARGNDRLARLLSLVQIGDYISYHLAIITGQDPTPIPAIEALKAELK